MLELNLASEKEKPEKGEKGDKGENQFLTKFFTATEEGDLICADLFQEKTNEEKGIYMTPILLQMLEFYN
jgi:hypothetical protein